MKINAIVLAGGDKEEVTNITGESKDEITISCKAFIDLNGKPMISYPIDALQKSKYVETIIIVAAHPMVTGDWQKQPKIISIIEAQDDIVENLKLAMEKRTNNNPILLVTTDIVELTASVIDDFIEKCKEKKAHFGYPIIRIENISKQFPEMKKTTTKFKEGTFAGGNIFFVHPELVSSNYDLIGKGFLARKSPFKLVRILGLKCTIKYSTQVLSISDLESRFSKIISKNTSGNFQYNAKAIESPWQLGIDIDSQIDLQLLQKKK